MKTLKIFTVILILAWIASPMIAEQEQSDQEKMMMQKWMAYATPGTPHAFFKHMEGEWEVTTKSWMKPGANPEVSTGSAQGKIILGGRYLKIYYKGTMMGMPFEGFGIHAFDNHLKKYLSTWVDNMGTGLMLSTGTLDETGKILSEYAEVDNIFTGAKEKTKSVTKIISADKFVMEMYMIGPEGEFKNLEVIHVRKKM